MALARELYPNFGPAKVAIETMESVVLASKATEKEIREDRQSLYEYLTKVTDILQVLVVDNAPQNAKETAFGPTTSFDPYLLKEEVKKGPYSGLMGRVLYIVPNHR